jgi:hypothetical protein
VVNVLNNISDYTPAEQNLYNTVVSSVSVNNEEPARGGGDIETVDEMRQNALAFFNAQNRVVTDKDYIVRSLAMPSQFGKLSKVFVVRDEQINAITEMYRVLAKNGKGVVVYDWYKHSILMNVTLLPFRASPSRSSASVIP